MRDFPLDLFKFNRSIEKQSISMVNSERLEVLRNHVVDNSNFHWENSTFFDLRSLSLVELIRLAIWSWYAPEEIKFLLQLDLEQSIKKLSFEDSIILEIILSSKAQMLIFLQETKLWHSREFFGNILDPNCDLVNLLKIRNHGFKKIVLPQRKRGYNDKGSRTPPHRELPEMDYEQVIDMNEIEAKRETHKWTFQFLEGWLS